MGFVNIFKEFFFFFFFKVEMKQDLWFKVLSYLGQDFNFSFPDFS